LRFSRIIDSDGDGIPNYYDLTPFPLMIPPPPLVASITSKAVPPPATFGISWNASSNTVYWVEYTTNPLSADWQRLLSVTNNDPTNKMVTAWDTNAPTSGQQRYYRVGYIP